MRQIQILLLAVFSVLLLGIVVVEVNSTNLLNNIVNNNKNKNNNNNNSNVSYLFTFSDAWCKNLSYVQKFETGKCNNMTLMGVPSSFRTFPTYKPDRLCTEMIWSGRDKTCKEKKEPQVFACDVCNSLIPGMNFMFTGCNTSRVMFHSLCKFEGEGKPCGKCLVHKPFSKGVESCHRIDCYDPAGYYSLAQVTRCPHVVEYQNFLGDSCKLKVLPRQQIPVGLCMNATYSSLTPPP